MRVHGSLENVLILEILAAMVLVRKFRNAGNRRDSKCPLLAKTEPEPMVRPTGVRFQGMSSRYACSEMTVSHPTQHAAHQLER